jgi:DNA-binding transcriptional ArsR family regulator
VSATREQYAKSTAIKTSIIAALRDNVGEEYTAAEIAQAMTSPLDIDVRQVGAILKVMAADGLVETRPHRNMHIYRLLEPALTWEPKPYRRTPSVVESKKSKETRASGFFIFL